MKTALIIVAAGRGRRFGAPLPKQYLPLSQGDDSSQKTILTITLERFLNQEAISLVQVVIGPDDQVLYEAARPNHSKILPPVVGGKERNDSVYEGLKALNKLPQEQKPDLVLIHDAARPFTPDAVIQDVIEATKTRGAAIPVLPIADTIKLSLDGQSTTQTVPRDQLWRAQTPQGFFLNTILNAHQEQQELPVTDDASLFENLGKSVALVAGSEENFKITTASDLTRAQGLYAPLLPSKNAANNRDTQQETKPMMLPRIGSGFDVHRFCEGDHVILCGVKIPHSYKLSGHSDADVAMHALTDAILGSIADGDIGSHFPPTDVQWKGQDSATFLEFACDRVKEKGGKISNIDVTIICERPKVGPHRDAMRARLSEICNLDLACVSVKATTTEKLGFTGRKEGIAAQASCLTLLPTVA